MSLVANIFTFKSRIHICAGICLKKNSGATDYRLPLPGSTVSLSAGSDLREEGRDVTRKELRLLCRSKVPAARHRGPPTNVVKPLHPFPRRASLSYLRCGEVSKSHRPL